MSDLAGKVAIVTGGAAGIGRATVERFVAEGARVVIADVNGPAGDALAAELGTEALFLRTDMGAPAEIAALVDGAVARFGRLDVMINNAAVSAAMHPRLLDEDFTDFERVFRIDLLGVMHGTQAAARAMRAGGRGGAIVNVTSTSGMLAGFGVICYRVAKAGVIQFSRSAAIDLAEYGIRVNCVAPGNIQTGINAFVPPGVTDVEGWKRTLDGVRKAGQPLKRSGTPDDVAQAMLYLASDRAAQVTGTVLPVDGGVTIGDPNNRLQEIIDAQRAATAAATAADLD